ncbi:MAG: hypothetical protein ACFFCH_08380 [Promethearchaeota archaeon]
MNYLTLAQPEVIEWLLDPTNPSVRFWTLLLLKDKTRTSAEVQATQKAILNSPVVKAIFGAQTPEGYWDLPQNIYAHKYTATTHTLLILAELGTPRIPPIEKGVEHLFRFQLNSGHFNTTLPKTSRGYASTISDTCCLDANILYYLAHFDYLSDSRTQKTIQFLIDHFNPEERGWKCRAYPINPDAVFPASCYMGLCKVLKAFSVFPETHRSPKIKNIIDQVVEVILENQIHKYLRDSDGNRKEKAGWKRFGFPLFYNSDILDVLSTLTRLNIRDPRVEDAVKSIVDAQQSDGKWLLKHTFNGKFWQDIEQKGKPSKWITLRALFVLKHFAGTLKG